MSMRLQTRVPVKAPRNKSSLKSIVPLSSGRVWSGRKRPFLFGAVGSALFPLEALLASCSAVLLLNPSAAAAASPEPHPSTMMLRVGTYHADEAPVADGEKWLGLFRGPEGDELLSVTRRVRRVHDEVLDDAPDVKTGKEISLADAGEPVILLHPRLKLSPGLVPRTSPDAFSTEGRGLLLGEKVPLGSSSGGEQSELALTGTVSLVDEELQQREIVLLLIGGNPRRSQKLLEHPTIDAAELPRIVWSGDLDRDGRTDLLIDSSDHYYVERWTLFLSSRAEGRSLVGVAATLETTGC